MTRNQHFRLRHTTAAAARWALATAVVAILVALGVPAVAQQALERTASADGARVYFIGIADGDEVTSPVVIRFGLSGMGVAPAGIDKQQTGHHHLLVDTDLADFGLPVPSDAGHRHFGGGQTEGSFDLPPGQHTLQLLLADYQHVPHDPPVMSQKITITVK